VYACRCASLSAALALGITVAAAGASPPPVSLGAALPRSVTVGKAFTVKLKLRTAGRVAVIARGPAARTFAARSVGARRYSARIVLPLAGRWTLAARVRGRSYRLGSVVARTPTPVLDPVILRTPAGVIARPDGSLLVAEGGGNRIARVDTATGGAGVCPSPGARIPQGRAPPRRIGAALGLQGAPPIRGMARTSAPPPA
jgi:hypothetical protein